LKFQTFHGGKGANQAVAAGRLGYPVSMIGKVGDDQFGPELKQGLSDAGVNVRAVSMARKTSSGVASILTDKSGQNSIAVVPGANGAVSPKDVQASAAMLGSAGIILCQLEIPLETVECVAAIAAKKGVPFMLDPAPARELPTALLRKVTYLTPNESEAGALCGRSHGELTVENVADYAAELIGRGPDNVVVKMGKMGAFFLSRGGESFFQPAFAVEAVDSTAAGDAFNAGLAVAVMRGETLNCAATYAAAVAAISVSRAGAQPSMPNDREVARFLKAAGFSRRSAERPEVAVAVASTE
jgi:ribokinase